MLFYCCTTSHAVGEWSSPRRSVAVANYIHCSLWIAEILGWKVNILGWGCSKMMVMKYLSRASKYKYIPSCIKRVKGADVSTWTVTLERWWFSVYSKGQLVSVLPSAGRLWFQGHCWLHSASWIRRNDFLHFGFAFLTTTVNLPYFKKMSYASGTTKWGRTAF